MSFHLISEPRTSAKVEFQLSIFLAAQFFRHTNVVYQHLPIHIGKLINRAIKTDAACDIPITIQLRVNTSNKVRVIGKVGAKFHTARFRVHCGSELKKIVVKVIGKGRSGKSKAQQQAQVRFFQHNDVVRKQSNRWQRYRNKKQITGHLFQYLAF
ncbi:Uncharacterised protein [Vibrio cholerae]|nr:Uncharacterised protein [Vibrio cholerae]CSB40039.1 Uncharacterised protein [Vibrio cholerae]CSB45535.1 Uncharacterised protein [Vibrio cholerae]CSB52640.1 Uncharacterised protein [Vibrio cholerae]CSC33855.1 Uncharacterised protein [Vibrio cholerae]